MDRSGELMPVAASAPRAAGDHGAVPSVNLVVERSAQPLGDRAATTLAQQRATFPGFVLLDREATSLAGHDAVRTLFTYHLPGHQIVVDQWLVVADGIATAVSCGTDTWGFPLDAAALEAIAATLVLPSAAPQAEASMEVPETNPPDPPIETRRGDEAELLAQVDVGVPHLELHVDERTVMAWHDGPAALVLAPEEDGSAVLVRLPAAALAVELTTRIPAIAPTAGRSLEPIELPPGVLAALLATRAVPEAVLPGDARDLLRDLAAGLRAWWRLEHHDGAGGVHARAEGLSTDDGPWRIVPAGDAMWLEPVRPRDLFAALCAATSPPRW